MSLGVFINSSVYLYVFKCINVYSYVFRCSYMNLGGIYMNLDVFI